ncbi:hypothetical protein CDCA_CDCA01G0184 [Cyanidium caldarium]|uniref:Calnexin n=1 Tax=Cyanidium caldarium TaxID=2771 RepID=A0AAV9IPI1_CYACA|nr:hypothetical protein CDCA_CDCA01G0184 [Cyanidium caldarium]
MCVRAVGDGRRRWLLTLLWAVMCLALVASRLRAVRAAAGADGDDDDVDVSDYFGAGDEAGGTDAVPVHPSLGDDDNNKEEAEPTAKIDPAARGGDYSVQVPVSEGDRLRVLLAETFQDDSGAVFSRWMRSSVDKYTGEWAVGGGEDAALAGDKGLLVTRKAQNYGIARAVESGPLRAGKLVLQYEVKHEETHTCGGAYLKLLTEPFGKGGAGLDKLEGATPYSIMFGPDKCGETNKVHFIFQSRNPKTGKLVEHHLQKAPTMPVLDRNTHLYTLVVDLDEGTFQVLIDQEARRNGSLRTDFQPPVEPPKEIDDPKDKKPADWVDTKMIADPAAKKPDDWDEDAPREIPDPQAVKPAGWLDDEPAKVPDPEAIKPAAWDDAEDGEWTPPLVANPKCADAPGCGEWKPPMIRNPAYKGKWKAPMITNPAYKGEWKPRRIANPEHYTVAHVELLPVTAVGAELWTMDQGILFDNVLLLSGEQAPAAAASFAQTTWARKAAVEKERAQRADEKKKKKAATGERSGGMQQAVLRAAKRALAQLERAAEAADHVLARIGLQTPLHRLVSFMQQQPLIAVALVPPVLVSLFLVCMGGIGGGGGNAAAAKRRGARKAARAKKTDERVPDATTAAAAAAEEEDEGDEVSGEAEARHEDSTGGSVRKRTARAQKSDE